MNPIQRIRDRTLRDRERNRQERQRLEDELTNPLEARVRQAMAEGMAEVTIDGFSQRQKPFRPKPPPDENRAGRLRVLFEKVQREVSFLTLRNA